MGKMNIALLGVTFTDYPLSNVGSTAFQLEHDWFTRQDLAIRTAASGGGTLLVEGTDYTLSVEDTGLSSRVTAAVGSGRNVMSTITVINATYQATALYFSGKYIADSNDAAYDDQLITVSSAGYTLPNGHRRAIVAMTTGASTQTLTLGPLLYNLDREVELHKMDSGAGECQFAASGSEKFIGPGGAQYSNLYVGRQGQRCRVRAMSDGWHIVGGVVQPVALEPDIGGGNHIHRATLYSGDPASTNWTAIACAAELPDGVIEIGIDANLSSANVRLVTFAASSGGTPDLTIHMSVATQRSWDAGQVFLDSVQQLWFQVDNADVSSLNVYMTSYKLGPV